MNSGKGWKLAAIKKMKDGSEMHIIKMDSGNKRSYAI